MEDKCFQGNTRSRSVDNSKGSAVRIFQQFLLMDASL